MKLGVVAVGHKLPAWVAQGCAEYIKRMPREMQLVMMEVKPETRGSKRREQLLAAEKTRVLPLLQNFTRFIVLDEKGDDLTTMALANCIQGWQREGGDIAFLIGSADGIDEELKARAQAKIRLSSLTLPHAMARLLVCEQLYRAMSVIKNLPYHREG